MTSIVKGLFGGKSSGEKILQQFSPAGFSAPGLTGRFNKRLNTFSLTRTPEAQGLLDDIRSGFAGQAQVLRDRAGAIAGSVPILSRLRGETGALRPGLESLRGDIRSLRGDLRPGFGRLTRSRIEGLRGLRDRTVGNLREELAKRRVAGSSFAAREIGAQEAEFAKMEDEVRAESFLQEMGATNELIMQELGIFGKEGDLISQEMSIALQEAGLTDLSFQSLAQAFQSSIAGAEQVLQQLNMETGLAAQLSTVASTLMNENITAQAEARAAQEAGALNFLGDVIGGIATVAAAG